jgi:hypothetical protein
MHNVRQQNRPPVPPGDLGPKQDHWREVGGREREVEGVGGGAERRAGGGRGGREGAERRARARGGDCAGGRGGGGGIGGHVIDAVDCVSVQTLAGIGIARIGARSNRPAAASSSVPHAGNGNAANRLHAIHVQIDSESAKQPPLSLSPYRSFVRSLARSLATRAIADTHARREPRLTRGATSPSVLYE